MQIKKNTGGKLKNNQKQGSHFFAMTKFHDISRVFLQNSRCNCPFFLMWPQHTLGFTPLQGARFDIYRTLVKL